MLHPCLLAIAAALAGPVDDLAWMAGAWRGEADGMVFEESWTPPIEGNMVGSFRMLKAGHPVFYELIVIETDEEGAHMRLKHFDAGLVGWEKRKRAVSFELTAAEPGAWAQFEDPNTGKKLVYRRDGDTLRVELTHEGGQDVFDFALLACPVTPATP